MSLGFGTRNRLQNLILPTRALSNRWRITPSFLLIGAQRCGTTSLYDYMCTHPNVEHALRKELMFFSRYFDQGLRWYQACFPLDVGRSGQSITGEGTPYYLCHPEAPQRVADALPDVRLIVLVRNPTKRAYSHFRHMTRNGMETLPFDEVVERVVSMPYETIERIAVEQMENRLDTTQDHPRSNILFYGMYANHIKNWMTVFPQDRFLIIRSADMFADPQQTLKQVFRFLELPPHELDTFPVRASGKESTPMSRDAEQTLTQYFAPHNQELSEWLGIDLDR